VRRPRELAILNQAVWRDGHSVSVVFALLSALSSAANLLTQRVSSGAGPKGSIWRVVAYLVRQPLWLFGMGVAVVAFVFQAAALRYGQLSQVQPLLVTELVFVLLLRRVWLRQHIRPAAWSSAALTCLALGISLLAAEPAVASRPRRHTPGRRQLRCSVEPSSS
jgi:hypothetical protein